MLRYILLSSRFYNIRRLLSLNRNILLYIYIVRYVRSSQHYLILCNVGLGYPIFWFYFRFVLYRRFYQYQMPQGQHHYLVVLHRQDLR